MERHCVKFCMFLDIILSLADYNFRECNINFYLFITCCSYERLQFCAPKFLNKLKYSVLQDFVFTPLNVPRTYALALDGNPIPFGRPV